MIHYILFIITLIFVSISLALLMAIVIMFAWPLTRLLCLKIIYLYKKVRHEL